MTEVWPPVSFCREVAVNPKSSARVGSRVKPQPAPIEREHVRGGQLSTAIAEPTNRAMLRGEGFVVAKNLRSAQGSSSDQSCKRDHSAKPKSRVRRSRRSIQSVEFVFSDTPPSNTDHPLAGLSHSERQSQRLLKLAEILAGAATRQAEEKATNEKEGYREH